MVLEIILDNMLNRMATQIHQPIPPATHPTYQPTHPPARRPACTHLTEFKSQLQLHCDVEVRIFKYDDGQLGHVNLSPIDLRLQVLTLETPG